MSLLLQLQCEDVRERLSVTDTWWRAPGGEPSQLTEAQWLLVRTPAFKAWFGDWESGLPGQAYSALLDAQGEPLVLYHGSGADFEAFDYAFTNQGDDELGSGFYFTTDRTEAFRYTQATRNDLPKLGGSAVPTVHEVFLNTRRPLAATQAGGLTRIEADALIKASPVLMDALTDHGDVDFEGLQEVFDRAVAAYQGRGSVPLLRRLFSVANDFYPDARHVEAFNRQVREVLGWDAVMKEFPALGKRHVVAWFPDQICSASSLERAGLRLTPESRPRMEQVGGMQP